MTAHFPAFEFKSSELTKLLILIVAIICSQPDLLFAQNASSQEMPANSHAASYGTGWECDYGYRTSGSGCSKMTKPANAHFNSYYSGSGWQCDRGFRRSESICIAITIPEHAYLNASGS
jgi:hypothetical protein